MWYTLLYYLFPSTPNLISRHVSPPVVMLTGFLGTSPRKMFGLRYFNYDVNKCGRRVLIPDLPPLGDNKLRALVAYTYLRGGSVDVNGRLLTFKGEYPEWDKDHPIDIIAHSQGGPCGDELLGLSPRGGVRSYIRMTAITQSLTHFIEELERSSSSMWYNLGWPSIVIYMLWVCNKLNAWIPCTRCVFDVYQKPTATPRDILSAACRGFLAASHLPSAAQAVEDNIYIVNIVGNTGLMSWAERLFTINPILVAAAALESLVLNRIDILDQDGLLGVSQQHYPDARRLYTDADLAPGVLEIVIPTNHLSTFSWLPYLVVPRFRPLLWEGFRWLNTIELKVASSVPS
jgi:hypothetical protein